MRYPNARRGETVEVVHGRTVPDPYRWLEDDHDENTRAFTAAQDALAQEYFDGLDAERADWRTALAALTVDEPGLPVQAGGRLFHVLTAAGAEHRTCLVDEPAGTRRVLVDTAGLSARRTVSLDEITPAPDGRHLAYHLSEGGADMSTLHVLDVDSGTDTEPPVTVGHPARVAWRSDSSGFFYQYCLDLQLSRCQVRWHRLGTAPEHDPVVFGHDAPPGRGHELSAAPADDWLAVTSLHGSDTRSDVHLVHAVTGEVREVAVGRDCLSRASFGPDGRLYLLTTLGAPRWRLVAVDPADPEPARWREVVGEQRGILYDYGVTPHGILAAHRHNVVSRIGLYPPSRDWPPRVVDLPGAGLAAVRGGEHARVSYTDHVTPPGVLRYDHDGGRLLPDPDLPAAAPRVAGVEVTQLFASSPDGTRVPMFVLSPEGVPSDRPLPTVVEGYGGWNVSWPPRYSAQRLAWVRSGGRYVVTNLRGGGEYGATWADAGMRQHQQNPVDDFLACAGMLVERGCSTPGMLAAVGGSKGGLTVGAAITQQPERFAAAVMQAPVLDMLRYEQLGGGQWTDGFGSVTDPEQFDWLYRISAYRRVTPGARYPAVLLIVGENDTRVHPAHARKMCAALQHASRSGRPVLLRRKPDVGHGSGSASRLRDWHADVLAFLSDQLSHGQLSRIALVPMR